MSRSSTLRPRRGRRLQSNTTRLSGGLLEGGQSVGHSLMQPCVASGAACCKEATSGGYDTRTYTARPGLFCPHPTSRRPRCVRHRPRASHRGICVVLAPAAGSPSPHKAFLLPPSAARYAPTGATTSSTNYGAIRVSAHAFERSWPKRVAAVRNKDRAHLGTQRAREHRGGT